MLSVLGGQGSGVQRVLLRVRAERGNKNKTALVSQGRFFFQGVFHVKQKVAYLIPEYCQRELPGVKVKKPSGRDSDPGEAVLHCQEQNPARVLAVLYLDVYSPASQVVARGRSSDLIVPVRAALRTGYHHRLAEFSPESFQLHDGFDIHLSRVALFAAVTPAPELLGFEVSLHSAAFLFTFDLCLPRAKFLHVVPEFLGVLLLFTSLRHSLQATLHAGLIGELDTFLVVLPQPLDQINSGLDQLHDCGPVLNQKQNDRNEAHAFPLPKI